MSNADSCCKDEQRPGVSFELLNNLSIAEAKRRGVLPSTFKSPLILMWDLTYRCTLQCIHCYNNSGSARAQQCQELSYDDLMRVVQYVEETEVPSICITGGDALLHKHFWDVARALAQIRKCSASTITNGWLMTPEVADRMARYFSAVQVSIDGATAETHDSIRGRQGSFERALAAVKYLVDAGVQTIVAFTAMKKNLHELPALIETLGQFDVKQIAIGTLFQLGRAASKDDLCLTQADHEVLYTQVETARKQSKDLRIGITDNVETWLQQVHQGLPNHRMMLTPDGTVKVCPFVPLSFGNIRTNDPHEIWKNSLGCLISNKAFIKYMRKMLETKNVLDQELVPFTRPDIPSHVVFGDASRAE